MRRKQFAAIMMSMIIAATACLPMSSIGALAAENAEAGMTEITAITETEEIEQEETEIVAEEMAPEDKIEVEEAPDSESEEEAQAADTEEETLITDYDDEQISGEADTAAKEEPAEADEDSQAADTVEMAADEEPEDAEESAEIITEENIEESDAVIEEAASEEVQRDAEEYGSDDYPYKNASTYPSNAADPWGYYYRQCTSFCAFRLNKTNGFALKNWYSGVNFGNANSWISAAKKVGITVNNTPAVGAVACWTTGTYGHVAWVCAVSGSNVTIEEYNWGTAEKYNKRTIAASNPSGYIHFKDIVTCSHKWIGEKVVKAPTATAKGQWQMKCRNCGANQNRDIPALGNASFANGRYMILSKDGSEKYVSVTPNQNYQGGNIALYSKGKADQTFTFTKNSNGSYTIKYRSYVLEAKGGFNGDQVQLNSSSGATNQQWYLVPAGDGWYHLCTPGTYYNMDVYYGNTADGTRIDTWLDNGTTDQLFKLVSAPACSHNWVITKVQTAPTATANGAWLFTCSECGETKTTSIPAYGSTNLANGKYMILSKLGTDKYVSVTPNQAYAGGNIALYSKGAANQAFEFTKKSNGCYLIKYGNYVLDVKDSKFNATVQLNSANGSANQDWYIESAGNGWYRLTTRCTYYNMDVAESGTVNGTNITTYYNDGYDNQLFKFVKVNEPINVSKLTVTVNAGSLIYDGTAKTPSVTVKQDGKVVTNGFKVTYQNNVNAGLKTASATITGDGVTYTGTKKVAFSILPSKTSRGDMFNLANNVKVTWYEVPGAKYYKVYREGITDPGETLDEPVIVTDRLIGWDAQSGLTNGHAYRYKIVASLTGEGDSSGDSPLSYSKLMYRLKTVVIRSVKNTSAGAVTVKYDKTTSGDSYVLQYSENQDMSNAKTKVVKGADTTSYTIGGLKKGKTYYISIRVRKTVDGVNYYTTFGVAKKVTITK